MITISQAAPNIVQRLEYDNWQHEFISDFHRDFNDPHIQEYLPIYHQDLVWALGKYQKVMSQEEIFEWRMFGKILRLEMFVYCPKEYKFPGCEDIANQEEE